MNLSSIVTIAEDNSLHSLLVHICEWSMFLGQILGHSFQNCSNDIFNLQVNLLKLKKSWTNISNNETGEMTVYLLIAT